MLLKTISPLFGLVNKLILVCDKLTKLNLSFNFVIPLINKDELNVELLLTFKLDNKLALPEIFNELFMLIEPFNIVLPETFKIDCIVPTLIVVGPEIETLDAIMQLLFTNNGP